MHYVDHPCHCAKLQLLAEAMSTAIVLFSPIYLFLCRTSPWSNQCTTSLLFPALAKLSEFCAEEMKSIILFSIKWTPCDEWTKSRDWIRCLKLLSFSCRSSMNPFQLTAVGVYFWSELIWCFISTATGWEGHRSNWFYLLQWVFMFHIKIQKLVLQIKRLNAREKKEDQSGNKHRPLYTFWSLKTVISGSYSLGILQPSWCLAEASTATAETACFDRRNFECQKP